MDPHRILVVGGSSGIGREITTLLAGRGDEVYVGSRSRDKLSDLRGVQHLPLDVTRPLAGLDTLPEALDGLVYCPGTIRLKPFDRLTQEDFLEDLQLNYLGAARVIQACLPRLKRAPAGASLVLFSTVAVQTGMRFHASTAGAKGAVEGLARALAAEYAPHIRANVIAPSLTDTPMAENLLSSDAKRRAAAERHPLQRIGSPAEIARVAGFLLSEAGGWITGQVVHVDGGMSSLRLFR